MVTITACYRRNFQRSCKTSGPIRRSFRDRFFQLSETEIIHNYCPRHVSVLLRRSLREINLQIIIVLKTIEPEAVFKQNVGVYVQTNHRKAEARF